MKFAVDRMLGRLAKWLRVLGYDAVFYRNLDGETVQRCLHEGRLVLTRGRRFRSIGSAGVVWIREDRLPEQLRELVRSGWIDLDRMERFSRCIRCNEPVAPLEKGMARGRVPEYVYQTRERFSICPSCRRVYWPGTHGERMIGYVEGYVRPRTQESQPPCSGP